jgi:molybdenum cofactor cytidylyltransferase
MLIALIPAAGHSNRMGRPKLALPLGNRTVLERVIDALRDARVDQIVVVLGPHVAELAEPARSAGADAMVLDQPTPDMRATIEAGLAHIEATHRPSHADAWLLCPADHPTLDAVIVRRLWEEFRKRPSSSIAVPTFEGKRGHPTIISWRHVEGIRNFAKDKGLNVYLRPFASETLEVPVDSADVLADLDTPEDYEKLRRRFAGLLGEQPDLFRGELAQ